MDVSNLTMKNSTAAPATPAVSSNKLAVKGNSLPDTGQARVSVEKLQANISSSVETSAPTPPDAAELRELVGQANESLQARFSDLKFTVDEATNINIVRVEDSETGELIRQFPSEAMVAIARALEDMQQGSVFEEKA